MNGNELQVFNFGENQVRVVEKSGQPWWVAKDVCDVLDINTEQIRRLDDDEKGLRKIQTPGGVQEMSIINESGLYALIIRSNKPEAKKFRKWITSEVLPALRKTGEYATPAAQQRKAKPSDDLTRKRLEIQEKNANWRTAKLILDGIKVFADVMTPESKTVFMAKYAELTTSHDMTRALPVATEKWYSAGEIGEMFGVSAAKIGKIANVNMLKAPEGESNEFGTWIRSKSKFSSKEVITWVYTDRAMVWFSEHFKIPKSA